MNIELSDFLNLSLEKLLAGEKISSLQPVLTHNSSDFSFLLSDFGETPASLGLRSKELIKAIPGIEAISIRPPMADVRLTKDWRVKWILQGQLPSIEPLGHNSKLPRSLAGALRTHEEFQKSDWGQMGGMAIQMASLPVSEFERVVVAAFRLATWESPGSDFYELTAGRFFSGQSNLAFKWLRSYFRAKSILKRDCSFMEIEPLCEGKEEFDFANALLQVPFCLSRAHELKAFALLPAAFHLIQQSFTRLWVAKPLESPTQMQETAFRFALLRRYVESCEAICRAAGIELKELDEPKRG